MSETAGRVSVVASGVLLLAVLGCGADPEMVAELNEAAKPAEEEPEDPPVRIDRPSFPPDDIGPLIDLDILGEFYHVSFAWGNGPLNWDRMDRGKRAAARGFADGGLARLEYGTVRIKEVYYAPGRMKQRWQEELRGGEWVRHGPTIHYEMDGSGGEIYFYLDGEKNGTRRWFDAKGNVIRSQKYKDDIPVGEP